LHHGGADTGVTAKPWGGRHPPAQIGIFVDNPTLCRGSDRHGKNCWAGGWLPQTNSGAGQWLGPAPGHVNKTGRRPACQVTCRHLAGAGDKKTEINGGRPKVGTRLSGQAGEGGAGHFFQFGWGHKLGFQGFAVVGDRRLGRGAGDAAGNLHQLHRGTGPQGTAQVKTDGGTRKQEPCLASGGCTFEKGPRGGGTAF